MIPASAALSLYEKDDAGYCSLYKFPKEIVDVIRGHGTSKGLGLVPVYSDRLWIDIDRDTVEEARQYAGKVVVPALQQMGADFTVWVSGGKGYHICIKIVPMFGKDVPHSQMMWVKEKGWLCDFSLYQHTRLFSNPGRKHPKTGVRKHKVFAQTGATLEIPIIKAPERSIVEDLSDADRARLAFIRLGSMLYDTPAPGMRHTTIWSTAMSMFEAGMPETLVLETMVYINKFITPPKPYEEICTAVKQAANQSR